MTALSSFTVLVTTRIAQLATINLVFLGLLFLGLGIFGVAPALTACLWATARLERNGMGELARGMWCQYRAEFVRANVVIGPGLAAAICLLGSAMVLPAIFAPVLVAAAVMAAIYTVAALVTLAAFSGSVADGYANALTAVALAPYRLLFSVFLLPVFALGSYLQPLLAFYFALSVWALIINLAIGPGLTSAQPIKNPSKEIQP